MKEYLVKGLVIFGITLFQIALVFIVFKFLLLPSLTANALTEQPAKESVAEEVTEDIDSLELSIDEESLKEVDNLPNPEDLKQGTLLQLDNIVINPSDARGRRYVVVSLTIFLHNIKIEGPNSIEEIAIRDAITMLLSKKTSLWLSDVDNREILRDEIRKVVKSILDGAENPRIFITKYVME